ncbi:MAG: YecA family protein [Rubrivivax sp.]|nr:YecA family protein [Rubrivivax sp.]MDP3083653.1 YecA family protein [Rubrivivax sp.]
MPQSPTADCRPLTDADIGTLQDLLDQVPEPLEALDVSSVDGFLCGVLLQPRPEPSARWLPFVTDLEGRELPAAFPTAALQALVLRRHAELALAIAERQWFDPWIYQLDDDASASETVLPWVAGFAAAMAQFPALMAVDHPELVEPLALLYMHFDPEDLEDADALQAVIETLEPPADLPEAVQDIVRSLMLIADVTRPRPAAPRRPGPNQRKPRR